MLLRKLKIEINRTANGTCFLFRSFAALRKTKRDVPSKTKCVITFEGTYLYAISTDSKIEVPNYRSEKLTDYQCPVLTNLKCWDKTLLRPSFQTASIKQLSDSPNASGHDISSSFSIVILLVASGAREREWLSRGGWGKGLLLRRFSLSINLELNPDCRYFNKFLRTRLWRTLLRSGYSASRGESSRWANVETNSTGDAF